MRTLLSFILLWSCTLLQAQDNWQQYRDRLPGWPADLTLSSVEAYTTALLTLRDELDQQLESKGDQQETALEGMTTAQAMQMAARYQEHMMEKSPEEISAMIEQVNTDQSDLLVSIQLGQDLESAMQRFRDEYSAAVGGIRQQYPCEMGIRDASDRCEERSAALKELGIRLQTEHFSGEQAGVRIAVEAMREHIYTKTLPSALRKEQEQYTALGVAPPAASNTGLEMVKSDIGLLLGCAELMGWVAGIRSNDNLFFTTGM
ncbi:MAG TPA: hypothetical protein P5550_03510 [Bacteroidales bacterium]|nr:hypothetical protein [Bacteroidales bacterium]HRZ76572.1 hypothetical protein [Bacteroidales bacterium]